jgi:hypothetical protein
MPALLRDGFRHEKTTRRWFSQMLVFTGCFGSPCCQILTTSSPAGKLKNWKSEKLTSRPATRSTRISGFQDFRFLPAHAVPEILPNETGRGAAGCGECREYAQSRSFWIDLYKQSSNVGNGALTCRSRASRGLPERTESCRLGG